MKLFLIILTLLSLPVEARTVQLTTSNTVVIRGPIDENSVADAQHALIKLDKARGMFSTYPIYIVLDTPGGSVMAGESFIEFARGISNVHTITIFAASMGSAIVQGMPGKRLMINTGIQMFHNASIGFPATDMDKVRTMLDFYQSMIEEMEQRTCSRMNIAYSDYKKKTANEWWMTAKQSIKNNAADEIVTVKCSQVLIDSRVETSIFTLFGPIKLKYSGCPLLQFPMP